MRKGFTLIEMIASVVIIGLLSIIVVPIIEQTLSDVKDDAYKTQIESIRSSARAWASDHISALPLNDGDTYLMTLGDLKLSGYVKTELLNPRNKVPFSDTMEITIINNDGDYVYAVGSEAANQINPDSPTISLNGATLLYINQGSAYSELGAVAKDSLGNIITYTITGTVNTSTLSTHQLVYSTTDNGLTTKAVRTVIIKDTVPPVLTIPADETILDTVLTYNIMTGVSANDNSGEAPLISVKTNLTLKITGRYLITYTATDKAGNITVKERVITITY